MEEERLFTERQRFNQIWLWLLLLGINIRFLFNLYQQLIYGQHGSSEGLNTNDLCIAAGISLLVTAIFLSSRLETVITSDGINVRFFPFQLTFKNYTWDKISKSFVRHYHPLTEYGGWGLRFGVFGSGKAYNVSGNKGIQIIFTNGSKLLIGTKKPTEVEDTLKMINHLDY
ncbi:hypothetical protein [Adhaeribacter aquaticus]|uniref:hypothetical protein n=1 Tax=Adhaeribacter aquaticus TaxID=299567 RepID=UPI00040875A3|nr:hypothetical protein [Adhaeribacter aquaticus]